MNYAKAYAQLHAEKLKVFPGYSIKPYIPSISLLIARHKPARILDFGSGKGYQYLNLRVHDTWGGQLPECYDPGVPQLKSWPEGVFGGIICTDVMEHIDGPDVDEVLAQIFSLADDRAFVFFGIACRASKGKRLPDGRDVHLTVKPPEWWERKLEDHRRDNLEIVAEYDTGVTA